MSVRRKSKSASFDFIVVGGGMTGLCAAIAAARHGVKTALIQDRPVLGGNASSEIRMHICSASGGGRKKNAEETGILREILLENRFLNPHYNYSVWDRVLFSAVKAEPNLTLFLNTSMRDASVQDGRVTEIQCWQLTTETNWTLTAPLFADCTGNGTLGFFAGAAFRTGSESKAEYNEPHAPEKANNHRMGNTLLFKAVDRGEAVPFIPPKGAWHFTEEMLRYRKHADLRTPDGSISEKEADPLLDKADAITREMVLDRYCLDYGYWWIELTGKGDDIIDEYEEIRDDLFNCIYGIWDHIKNGGDHGADNYELAWVGMLPGMRESRRLEGEYMLNENDLIANRVFPDAVAYGGWEVDNHVPHGILDWKIMPSEIYPFKGLYSIPYRSYVSADISNLFIGGRALGASKLAMASSRIMGTCAVGGQAVGTAAALCVKYGCRPHGVLEHIDELQQILLKDDCYIPGFSNHDPKDLARTASITASSGCESAANVIDGISRMDDSGEHLWRSGSFGKGGEWICLSLPKAVNLSQIRLTFDPDLNKGIRLTMSSRSIRSQGSALPPTLVRDYDILLMRRGEIIQTLSIRNNYQRLRVHEVQTTCDAVKIMVYATHGTTEARIFEIRLYE